MGLDLGSIGQWEVLRRAVVHVALCEYQLNPITMHDGVSSTVLNDRWEALLRTVSAGSVTRRYDLPWERGYAASVLSSNFVPAPIVIPALPPVFIPSELHPYQNKLPRKQLEFCWTLIRLWALGQSLQVGFAR